MILINQWGSEISQRIRAAAPAVEVIDVQVDELPPDGTVAQALFTPIRRDWQAPGSPVEICRRHGVKWVQVNGAGAEGLPPELYEDGRIVTTGRTAAATGISEFVLGSMLAFAKRFPLTWLSEPPPEGMIDMGRWLGYDEAQAAWSPPPIWGWAPMLGLAGRTLGIVGLGGVGQEVARKALAFDMRVIAMRRHPAPSPVAGVEMVETIEQLLPHSDHVVLALPLTPRTRHLLNDETLALVKPGVHIVNISRGQHVDGDALRRALDGGRVAFASLDVHDPTPLPAGHWCYSHPHVHVSPHLSWVTPEGPGTVEIFLENLRRYLAGEPLNNVVDVLEGY